MSLSRKFISDEEIHTAGKGAYIDWVRACIDKALEAAGVTRLSFLAGPAFAHPWYPANTEHVRCYIQPAKPQPSAEERIAAALKEHDRDHPGCTQLPSEFSACKMAAKLRGEN